MDMESLLGMKIIPIHALLDENCGLNPATDPRQKLGDAELIMVRDVMSRRQCLVFGKEIIPDIIHVFFGITEVFLPF